MRIQGAGGEIRAGPHVAAVLGSWSLERPTEALSAGRWVATAQVRRRDAFWAAHGGVFDFVVPAGGIAWVWRGVEVAWGEQGISIQGSGKPEVGVWLATGS